MKPKKIISRFTLKVFFLILYIIMVSFCLIYLHYIQSQSNNNFKTGITHINFISATYYENSTVYPENTVVVFFMSQKNWSESNILFCESLAISSEKKLLSVKSPAPVVTAINTFPECRWGMYMTNCKVIPNPNSLSLSSDRDFEPVTLPLRYAYKPKHNVINCLGYLYYAETWQSILLSLEMNRQYGVGLQVYYIQSMRTQTLNLLKSYQAAGEVEIELWNLINLGRDHKNEYDPNSEIEWGNQAGAATDCFLKYREAAEFIISYDIDEILFPKLGKNYYEEFQKLSLIYPHAGSFMYDRFTSEIVAANSPLNFSLSRMLNSIQITNEWVLGKYVVRPSRIETLWIHRPEKFVKNYTQVIITENFMLHLRRWKMIDAKNTTSWDEATTTYKIKNPHKEQIKDIFGENNIEIFDKNSQEFIKNNAWKTFSELPEKVYYYPSFIKCFHDIRMELLHKTFKNCPGQILCNFPQFENVSCSVANKQYSHQHLSYKLKIHVPLTNEFVILPNGCKMDLF